MKPSEPDLLPETERRETPGQEAALLAWDKQVGKALHSDNKVALKDLFLELSSLVAPDQVSHEWLRVVSGWDARAKTG